RKVGTLDALDAQDAALPAAHGVSLAVDRLGLSFGGLKAVDAVSFAAPAGRITSIIGPNGAGKTTVLNLVCGFYNADTGSVKLGETELAGRPVHRIARAGIART